MKNENRAEIIMCVFGVGFGVLTTSPWDLGRRSARGNAPSELLGFWNEPPDGGGNAQRRRSGFRFRDGLGNFVDGHCAPSQLPVTSILA